MANALYYCDNLGVLRHEIASKSVDLIYLDPPFNSQANYNVLFKSPSGKAADAQIEAFEDTWRWGEQAERAFSEVLTSPNTQAAELLRAMRSFLGENDMMAYLAMMAVGLIELHRVLKPTGSLYLHCDPTASVRSEEGVNMAIIVLTMTLVSDMDAGSKAKRLPRGLDERAASLWKFFRTTAGPDAALDPRNRTRSLLRPWGREWPAAAFDQPEMRGSDLI